MLPHWLPGRSGSCASERHATTQGAPRWFFSSLLDFFYAKLIEFNVDMDTVTLTRPDDMHLHVRDGAAMAAVLPHSAAQFGRAIIMPNLRPPVTTTEAALEYRQRIVAALAPGQVFTPLMTLYLTDNTAPDEVRRARDSGVVHAFKLYPAGATTNSDAGVSDLRRCRAVLEVMQELGMPLLVHGEVTDSTVDLFDRERIFIERELIPLRRDFPALRVVLEHITTRDAAEYVRDADGPVAATLTAHHLLYNRNAIFVGGIRPHYYCLPVLKRETHRLALLDAAVSGNARFFLGTDSAPHARDTKEAACGCAGCYTALHALPLYAEAFDMAGRLDRLDDFASRFGAEFYGLPRNRGSVTLVRRETRVPEEVNYADGTLVPLRAGEVLKWAVTDTVGAAL